MTRLQRILVVTDDAHSELIRGALEEQGFAVTAAQDYESAYCQLLDSPIDLVVMDLALAIDGADLIERVRNTARLQKTLILVLAEWGTGQSTLALSRGADAYEPKPLDVSRLITSVERLLRQELALVE